MDLEFKMIFNEKREMTPAIFFFFDYVELFWVVVIIRSDRTNTTFE